MIFGDRIRAVTDKGLGGPEGQPILGLGMEGQESRPCPTPSRELRKGTWLAASCTVLRGGEAGPG